MQKLIKDFQPQEEKYQHHYTKFSEFLLCYLKSENKNETKNRYLMYRFLNAYVEATKNSEFVKIVLDLASQFGDPRAKIVLTLQDILKLEICLKSSNFKVFELKEQER